MKQIRFFAFALLLIFTANFSAMALSLEAQAVIEEMRERLLQREVISSSVATSVASDDYIPGRDLRVALSRARSVLHRGQYQDFAQVLTKPQSSSDTTIDNISDDYRPGSLLGKAMEKVRYVRRQSWPEVHMAYEDENEYEYEVSQPVVLVKAPAAPEASFVQANLPQKIDRPKPPVSKAVASVSSASYRDKMPISRTPEFVEVDTAQRLEQRRKQLLRSKNLPDLSSPSESAMMQASAQAQTPDAEQESKEFNRFISRYEYKMPSNYRIIVR